jgi:hypothetical protein
LGGGTIFQNVSAGSHFHTFHEIILIVVHGEEQDLGLGPVFLDLPRRLKTAESGHADVHQHDVRPHLGGLVNGIAAIGRFSDDFHVRLGGDKRANTLAKQRVIIRQHDANLCHNVCQTS